VFVQKLCVEVELTFLYVTGSTGYVWSSIQAQHQYALLRDSDPCTAHVCYVTMIVPFIVINRSTQKHLGTDLYPCKHFSTFRKWGYLILCELYFLSNLNLPYQYWHLSYCIMRGRKCYIYTITLQQSPRNATNETWDIVCV